MYRLNHQPLYENEKKSVKGISNHGHLDFKLKRDTTQKKKSRTKLIHKPKRDYYLSGRT